jgi:epoxyqueuosine reductase
MRYLERRREERERPERLLRDIRSVIVLGHGYDSGLPNTEHPEEGNISRYAWAEDYHEVLGEKLNSFTQWLEARRSEARCFTSVDAVPEPDRCGTCERCIEVCPTRAIVAPYQLDARLCISYLTIELRGPIPRELRPLIGNRIFGCDDCQEVCPWNRFSRPTEEGRFYPRDGVRNQPLTSFLNLDEIAFKKKFAGSAILRAKRRGFLRNVCVAIGNSGKPELAEALVPMLCDPEPLVRGHAVWAYAQLLGIAGRPKLEERQRNETDSWVREELRAAL